MNWLLKLSQFNTYYHGTNNQFDVSEFKSENNSVQNFGLLGLIDVTRYGIFYRIHEILQKNLEPTS